MKDKEVQEDVKEKMISKLSIALTTVAIILLSLGVGVIRSNPLDLKNITPGLILIIAGIVVAVIWEREFKSKMFLELKG